MSASANPANVVISSNARFTFLTDRMIRLEWAEDGVFEDLATLTVANRHTEPVVFTRKEYGGTLVLKTEYLTLTHTPDSKPLSKKNLSIEFKFNGESVVWHPGKKDRRNLKGTAETLDQAHGSQLRKWVPVEEKDPSRPVLVDGGTAVWQGDMKPIPLCDGLISRSGWAVVDDSSSVVLDPELCDWQPWVRERTPGTRQDLYFFWTTKPLCAMADWFSGSRRSLRAMPSATGTAVTGPIPTKSSNSWLRISTPWACRSMCW
jgi:hypothetical protein